MKNSISANTCSNKGTFCTSNTCTKFNFLLIFCFFCFASFFFTRFTNWHTPKKNVICCLNKQVHHQHECQRMHHHQIQLLFQVKTLFFLSLCMCLCVCVCCFFFCVRFFNFLFGVYICFGFFFFWVGLLCPCAE